MEYQDLACGGGMVAKLIAGGLQTPIYVVGTSGFDTHQHQVDATDTTTGTHANLLMRLSDAVTAFVNDCKNLGVGQRVMGMTFSEFGRRMKSNDTFGTDHGVAEPVFLFGSPVGQGIIGTNVPFPAVTTVNNNAPMQVDFRSVYGSILQQWFGVTAAQLQATLFRNFPTIPVIG